MSETRTDDFKVGDKVRIRPGIEHGEVDSVARIFAALRDRQVDGVIETTDSGVKTRPITANFEGEKFCFSYGELITSREAGQIDHLLKENSDLRMERRKLKRKHERLRDAIDEIAGELIVARPVNDIISDISRIANDAIGADEDDAV